jgi:hypothetical protein
VSPLGCRESVKEIKTSFPFFNCSKRPDSIIRPIESAFTRLARDNIFKEKHYVKSDIRN